MAFVETRTTFPDFQTSKDFFKSGLGSAPSPDVQITGGVGGAAVQQPGVTQPAQGVSQPTALPATQPTAAPQATPPVSPSQLAQPTYEPVPFDFQQAGTATSKLFDPVTGATQAGEEQLTEFADLFRTEAGPSRTFGGIGGEETLESAVMGGPLGPAQELVGAQYQGPFGLDPEAAGGLMALTGQLRAREQALGTGGGISEILTQSTPGITGGEARFTAEDLLTPEYRTQLGEVTAGIDPFAGRLEEEILGTQAFAQQRTGEEEEIARLSGEYLTGRQAGIETGIETEVRTQLDRQAEATDIWSDVTQASSATEIADVLRKAQESGIMDPSVDVDRFNTELQQAITAAPEQYQAILDQEKYASLKDVPIGEIGVDNKGRQTYLIDGKDFRTVLGAKSAEAVAFKQRQGELEEAFSPARGRPFPMGRPTGEEPSIGQLASPLYFGEDINVPQIREFLNFDPGIRPSRGNVSTEEQRSQFNRIQEIMGNLDRIAESTTPFRAATIGASLDEYLAAEEEALTAQKETLDEGGKQWFNMVKKARKDYRKAERESDWGKVGAVVGGVLGAVVGTVVGGPGLGTVAGTGIGAGVGRQAGEALA